MSLHGFAGKILYVDLTRGEVSEKPLAPELAKDFIGGLGLTIKLAYDNIKPGVDALSSDNTIVLGAGPLVGTNLPATSRVYAVSKLPSSKTIGWCGGGGVNFGSQLKYAGYDHVVIQGRSEKPVYLKITDEKVELKDAGDLWGTGVEECYERLTQDMGRPSGVMSIGPAAENKVAFSMAFIDRLATLGRGGFGAVMGSKNLKAITVKGKLGIDVADRKTYRSLNNTLLKTMREYPYLEEWQSLGLIKSLPLVPRETYEIVKKRRIACVSCPIGDKDVIQIPDGEHQGLVACSSSAVNLFIPMVYGMKDYRDAVALSSSLDEYGLDIFEFFGIMGFAGVLAENGIIPKDRLDHDIDLKDLHSMSAWAKKTSEREGLGDILARGVQALIEEFGEQAQDYAPPIIKGMLPYVGPKAPLSWNLFGTMELGQVLDPRGPHVGASGSPTYFAKRPLEVFPKHLRRMGVPEQAIERILPGLGTPEQSLRVGTLLKYSQSWFAMLGSLGICARAQINRFYNAELCAKLYQATTGIPTELDDLRERVDRVWTLLRLANLREGFSQADEALPEKWFKGPGFKDYLTEKNQTPEQMQQMIEDYYKEWGWDPETGIPTP